MSLLSLLDFADSSVEKPSEYAIKKITGDGYVEPKVGMLVKFVGGSYQESLARIVAICETSRFGSPHIVVLPLHMEQHPSNHVFYRPEFIVWVSDDPPVVQDKGPCLYDRIRNLRQNVQRAMNRIDEAGEIGNYSLLNRLHQALTSHAGIPSQYHWFWTTVAESLIDPRKISCGAVIEQADNDQRRKCLTMGRFLKTYARQFGFRVTDPEADRIAHMVGCHFPNSYNYSFEVVNGMDVFDTYSEHTDVGSCMSGEDYPLWYALNEDKVSMLKIYLDGMFYGRALLWHTDQGKTVLDRIYPSDCGPHTIAAHNYAEQMGWDYKTCQSADDGCLKSGCWDYTVSMTTVGDPAIWSRDTGYPYLDTFKYTDNDPGWDDTIKLCLEERAYSFINTDGYWEDTECTCCSNCGESVHEDDIYRSPHGEPYCEYCYGQFYTDLEYRHNGEWIERTVDAEDARCCDSCGEDRLTEHLMGVGSEQWCNDCVEADAITCAGCREMIPADKSKKIDGRDYCNDCVEDCESCGRLTPCNAPCEECKPAAELVAV